MQIRVKCDCGEAEGSCREWAIVELQGTIEPHPSLQHRLQNLNIGSLCRPSPQQVYSFTVGYHELTGSKVSLKKPLLVLKKVRRQDVDQTSCGDDNNCRVELEVIGVVRHKILFKTRPKALISKTQPTAKKARGSMLGSDSSNPSA